MDWRCELVGNKPDLSGSVVLVGLPGIGNVGKIVTDFVVEQMKADKIADFISVHMPASVFVTEDNMIALPKIELFFKDTGKQKLLILTGDTQPSDDEGTYTLCEAFLDFIQENKCCDIITLGGIGLKSLPKNPKVYITGNDKDLIEKYKKDTGMISELYGIVGPIFGISGLLLGLSQRRKFASVSILAETLADPMHLGLTSAREILKVLNSKLSLEIDLKNLNKEIDEIESKMKLSDDLTRVPRKRKKDDGDISYIG